MKKLISLQLCLTLVVALAVPVFAASDEAVKAADTLYSLGLMQGSGSNADGTPDFALDRAPTRQEAVTMLVRLLGKDSEAKAGSWNMSFTDVDEWARPYVGYAYAKGLTSGTSATTFGGSQTMSASQYLTLILRALGYDSGTDFQWDKAWELSDRLGITNGEYNAESAFLRGDAVVISQKALSTAIKGTDGTLLSKLVREGAVTEAAVKAAGLSDALEAAFSLSWRDFVNATRADYVQYFQTGSKTYGISGGNYMYLSDARVVDGELYVRTNAVESINYVVYQLANLASGNYTTSSSSNPYLAGEVTATNYDKCPVSCTGVTPVYTSITQFTYKWAFVGGSKTLSSPGSVTTNGFVNSGVRMMGVPTDSARQVDYYMNLNDFLKFFGISGKLTYVAHDATLGIDNVLVFTSTETKKK